MHNVKYFFIIIFSFSMLYLFAQNEDKDSIVNVSNIKDISLVKNADSVLITYTVFQDKETSIDADFSPSDTIAYSKSKKLTCKEVEKLNMFLSSGQSYNKSHALLGHSDISIQYYKGGIVVQDIYISSITRNISLYVSKYALKQSINRHFELFLTQLLIRKGVWSKEMKFPSFYYIIIMGDWILPEVKKEKIELVKKHAKAFLQRRIN